MSVDSNFVLNGVNGHLTPPTSTPSPSPASDPESALQSLIASHPLAQSLSSDSYISRSRAILSIPESSGPFHLTHHSLATTNTIPVPPVVFSAAPEALSPYDPECAALLAKPATKPPDVADGRLWAFYFLGSALAGHPGTVHGGLSATLLDEVMGIASFGVLRSEKAMTKELNIRYKRPVSSNSYVLVRAECERFEGRRAWMKGWIELLGEDGERTLCVEGQSEFVVPKAHWKGA